MQPSEYFAFYNMYHSMESTDSTNVWVQTDAPPLIPERQNLPKVKIKLFISDLPLWGNHLDINLR